MKSMRIVYDDNEKLNELINEVYYNEGNMGKIPNEFSQNLKVESSVLKTILSDMEEFEIKVENKDLIKGIMKFRTKEVNEEIYLIPTSTYCIKKNKEKDRYTFY
ncbi:MAG: hypothetical protein SLAVMIC_00275 [uncultured marine phage]|uniref:Uncharacterized protein n=1 Tax=uncultured marine phage TaxID=707152 RepID=A0A8D9C8N0_9VIRU|nr:MAG: hypothetical protein SLAVMIC_00275 [uncultured marine phage]